MAINPMQAPIDYLGQMGITPQSPTQALLEGLQLGAVFKQQRAEQEQAAKAQAFNAAASAYYRNPTLQGARDLQANFPEYAEQFSAETKNLTAEQRMNEATYGMQVAAAIGSGQIETAQSMLRQQARAAQEKGEDSTVWENMSQLAANDPQAAYALALQFTSAGYPDEAAKIAESWKELGIGAPEEGNRFLTPEEISAIPGLDPNRAYQQNLETGRVTAVGGAGTTINMPAEPPKLGKTPENWYNTYVSAINQNADLDNLIEKVDLSLSGVLAEDQVAVLRLAELFGVASEDATKTLEATQEVTRGLAESALQARSLIAGQGQGTITDAEQKLLLAARGGSINFTKAELKTLFGAIKKINDRAAPEMARRIRAAAKRGSLEAQVFADLLGQETTAPPPSKTPSSDLTDEELKDLYAPKDR